MPTQRSSFKAVADLPAFEQALLRFVAEHGAIPLDLLVRLTDSNIRSIRPLVLRLEREGFLRSTAYAVDKHLWFTLRASTARQLQAGYWVHPPNAISLNHRRAVIEASLELTSELPKGRWVTEQTILRCGSRPAEIPDAIFNFNDERWAIEVQLSRQGAPRTYNRVVALLARYDRVVYFCADHVISSLRAAKAAFPSRLEVREVTTASWFTRPQSRPHKDDYRPSAREAKLLRLIVEEGTIAVDQLAKLTGRKLSSLRKELTHLERHGFLQQGLALPDSPPWVWCTFKGTTASGSPLSSIWKPGPSRLPRRRALMSVRLALTGPGLPGRWITARQLGHGSPRGIYTSMAVLEQRGKRTAIVVNPELRLQVARTSRRIEPFASQYDAVLWYCNPTTARCAAAEIARRGLSNMEVRELPASAIAHFDSVAVPTRRHEL